MAAESIINAERTPQAPKVIMEALLIPKGLEAKTMAPAIVSAKAWHDDVPKGIDGIKTVQASDEKRFIGINRMLKET